MTDADPVIKSYRKAVTAMKGRGAKDPLSWFFQANIHGAWRNDGNDPGWRWCMHGNWWFLPWHRGYLYYFERIVRKLSEDDDFRLPYWSWEKSGGDVLPVPFRAAGPPNATNTLHDATRYRGVNAGDPIRRRGMAGTFAADWEKAARVAEFTTQVAATSFGGLKARRTMPPQRPSELSHGAMEALAHDLVHVCTAPTNGTGNMGHPATAARDPIFWPHHANVDRLWNRWLDTKGHYNPEDADWFGQEFPFYDENGKEVKASVQEILDLAGESYRYDDDRMVVFGDPPRPPGKGMAEKIAVVPVASVQPMLSLGSTPFSKPLPFEMGAKPRVVGALATSPAPGAPQPAVVLRVENIRPPTKANVMYEVFVTKAGEKPSAKYYLGPVSFFGHGGGHDHEEDAKKEVTQSFDATEVIRRIRRENKNELPDLQVAVIPHSTDPAVSDEELAKQKIEIPISNITLKLITQEKE